MKKLIQMTALASACLAGNATQAAELTRLHISGARESLIQNINSLR